MVHQRREIVSPLFFVLRCDCWEKIISVFIDESRDFGFVGDASKYYIITFVFHNQKDDITSNINKLANKPVFHAGPIIRREYIIGIKILLVLLLIQKERCLLVYLNLV